MECVVGTGFINLVTRSDRRWRRIATSRSGDTVLCGRGRGLVCEVRAKVGGGRGERCVPVKEGSADEEDYVKAGGSETYSVRMQQIKSMDRLSRLPDKLPPIINGDKPLDLVVIGCGPSGLALAAESAKLGLRVGLIGPVLPFTSNYGVWEDEFQDLGLSKCIEHVWIVYLDDGNPILIGRAYGRVSRHLLHEELLESCCEDVIDIDDDA